MNNASKKTAAIMVLILVGVVGAWKFMSKSTDDTSDNTSNTQSAVKKSDTSVKKDTDTKSSDSNATTANETADASGKSVMEKKMEGMNHDSMPMMDAKKVSVKSEYETPAGSDPIGFSVTVDKEGIITDAALEVLASNEISEKWQQNVAKLLPTAIKGKKLSELTKVDKIGGSSLTTEAFNAALPQLKAQL